MQITRPNDQSFLPITLLGYGTTAVFLTRTKYFVWKEGSLSVVKTKKQEEEQ